MSVFFWFTDLLVPVVIILVGMVFRKEKNLPINNFIGYRTKRSKSSPEAWAFAQVEMARQFLKAGLTGVVIVVLDKLFIPLAAEYLCLINCGINVVLVIAVIPIVESKLKKRFNLL